MGVKYFVGNLSKVVLLRVFPGSDIIEGIEETCRDLHIDSRAIPVAWAAFKGPLFLSVFHWKKIGAGYSEPKTVEGPLEIPVGPGDDR